MRAFKHINAESVEETINILQHYKGKAKINAGGSDLLLVLKDSILPEYPEAVINIKNVPGLDFISCNDESVEIGALATLDHICRSSLLSQKYSILTDAAKSVAGPQIRNLATTGGNLMQDVRCWYYRYSAKIGGPVKCLRKGNGPCLAVKGDNRYHAVIDGKKCFAVCPSDMATALTALDAVVTVAGPDGKRAVPVADIYNPLDKNIKGDELLLKISFPALSKNSMQRFVKFTLRKPVDYAVVSAASTCEIKDGMVEDIRIVLGAVSCRPYRAKAAEDFLKGWMLDEKTAAIAAEKAVEDAKPLSKNAYKVDIAKSLVKDILFSFC